MNSKFTYRVDQTEKILNLLYRIGRSIPVLFPIILKAILNNKRIIKK